MQEDKTILLPLDGSEASLSAFFPAKCVAQYFNMTLNVLYVSDEKISTDELIQKLKLKEEDLPTIIVNHRTGDVTEEILKESEKSSLIIMCTHGESLDMKKIAGNITFNVMKRVNIPLFVIRPDVKFDLEQSCWNPQKMLIPLNGNPDTANALAPILKLFSEMHPDIELLHISCTKDKPSKDEGCLTAPYYQDYQQYEWPSWSKEFIRRFCDVLRENNKKVKIKLSLGRGNPADEIINKAVALKSDFIAIAWHGEIGPLKARVLQKVMKKAPCPLLLVKITK